MENRYVITPQRYSDWARHPVHPSRAAGVIRVIWIVLFVFCAAIGVWMAWRGDWVFAAVYGALLLFVLFRAIVWPRVLLRRQFRRLLQLQQAPEWLRIVRLDDTLTVTDGSASRAFPYRDLAEVRELGDFWGLLFPDSVVIRLKKGTFTKGGAPVPDEQALSFLRTRAPRAVFP